MNMVQMLSGTAWGMLTSLQLLETLIEALLNDEPSEIAKQIFGLRLIDVQAEIDSLKNSIQIWAKNP